MSVSGDADAAAAPVRWAPVGIAERWGEPRLGYRSWERRDEHRRPVGPAVDHRSHWRLQVPHRAQQVTVCRRPLDIARSAWPPRSPASPAPRSCWWSGLLYARLLAGPISLTFLASHIQQALEREFAGLGVDIEDVSARLSEAGTVAFELTNIRVSMPPDRRSPSRRRPRCRSAARALQDGHLAPETIDLISPRLLLYYSEDGNLSVKFTPPGDAVDDAPGKAPALRGSHAERRCAEGCSRRLDAIAYRSRPDPVGSLRARPPTRARQRLPARRGARDRRPSSSTTAAARASGACSDLDIDLDHRRSRSSIAGRARIESLTGPWEVNFRTTEAANANSLQLALSVQGLVPRGLARSVPQLAILDGVRYAGLGGSPARRVEHRRGAERHHRHRHGARHDRRCPGSGGGRPCRSTAATSRCPTTTRRAASTSRRPCSSGATAACSSPARSCTRRREPKVRAGSTTSSRPAAGSAPSRPSISASPSTTGARAAPSSPERGRVVLNQFVLRAGGAEVSAQGDIADMAGAMQTRLEGKIGPMSADTFKSLWPERAGAQVARVGGTSSGARQRAGRHLPGRLRRRHVRHRLEPGQLAARIAGDRRLRPRLQRARRLADARRAARPACAWRATPWRSPRPMRP